MKAPGVHPVAAMAGLLVLPVMPVMACTEPDVTPQPKPAPTCLDYEEIVSDVPDIPLAYQTEHLDIYLDPESFLCAGSALDYERHVQYVADQLEIDIQRRIPVYVTQHAAPYCLLGSAGCSTVDGVVFVDSGIAYHELTHGVACEIRASAVATLAEGLAVAFEPESNDWSGMPSEFAELTAKPQGFPNYPEAGHFVRWLLKQLSPAEFRDLYRDATYDAGVWDTLVAAYGPTLEQDYLDTKPYIWSEPRRCADVPFLEQDPEGGWTFEVTLDCNDESTYGPYERQDTYYAKRSDQMHQSFVIDVPEDAGTFVVTGEPYPFAYMKVKRCPLQDSYATKEEGDAGLDGDIVGLNFQSIGEFEFTAPGLWRLDIVHKYGPPVDAWFTFTPGTLP